MLEIIFIIALVVFVVFGLLTKINRRQKFWSSTPKEREEFINKNMKFWEVSLFVIGVIFLSFSIIIFSSDNLIGDSLSDSKISMLISFVFGSIFLLTSFFMRRIFKWFFQNNNPLEMRVNIVKYIFLFSSILSAIIALLTLVGVIMLNNGDINIFMGIFYCGVTLILLVLSFIVPSLLKKK